MEMTQLTKEYILTTTARLAQESGINPQDVLDCLEIFVMSKEQDLGRPLTIEEYRQEASDALYEWDI